MAERCGIRKWEKGGYLFPSDDSDAAFQPALAIEEGGPSGGSVAGKKAGTRVLELYNSLTQENPSGSIDS
jgi:hypothetical protein